MTPKRNDELYESNPKITLSNPTIGWTTLNIGKFSIPGISYINPFLIDDLIEWFRAEIEEKDYVIRLDREGLGMAYLVSTQTQDILAVCDSGTSMTSIFYDSDNICESAAALADSIEENFDNWVLWQCPEDDEKEIAQAKADVTRKIQCLRNLNQYKKNN